MIERVKGGKQGGNITEMYGSFSDEDLNEWERMPQNIRVLTSSAFGAWLLRRDKKMREENE